jgi:site-specific recombinase XerD
LLCLISCTGLRVSEALKLHLSDITEEGLLIRATKFQQSRLVPLHDSARRGLQQYVVVRNRVAKTSPMVFVSRRGTGLPIRRGPGAAAFRISDIHSQSGR